MSHACMRTRRSVHTASSSSSVLPRAHLVPGSRHRDSSSSYLRARIVRELEDPWKALIVPLRILKFTLLQITMQRLDEFLSTNSGCRSGRIQQPQPKPEIGAKLRWGDSGSSLKLTSTEASIYNKEPLLYNDSSLELLFSLQLAPQSDLHRCTTPTDISVFELGYMRRLS
ncbi:hypothetical protein PGTUg99_011049 [Puccinia graminis f. sp. tritici]|uniref:Uncharacterized protein n=1 Tax=Puccinia graminis f. sp. tritici TaxID=56615 RepID=A0A5B0N920_PUCGR|nr:hypothetical protein PGTUg99_011049 [Puccinia graminis f. sp. tritici]